MTDPLLTWRHVIVDRLTWNLTDPPWRPCGCHMAHDTVLPKHGIIPTHLQPAPVREMHCLRVDLTLQSTPNFDRHVYATPLLSGAKFYIPAIVLKRVTKDYTPISHLITFSETDQNQTSPALPAALQTARTPNSSDKKNTPSTPLNSSRRDEQNLVSKTFI